MDNISTDTSEIFGSEISSIVNERGDILKQIRRYYMINSNCYISNRLYTNMYIWKIERLIT
jgi:hypothetical protein